jgi:hypothetical protein
MRLRAGARCFDRYRAEFGLGRALDEAVADERLQRSP